MSVEWGGVFVSYEMLRCRHEDRQVEWATEAKFWAVWVSPKS